MATDSLVLIERGNKSTHDEPAAFLMNSDFISRDQIPVLPFELAKEENSF